MARTRCQGEQPQTLLKFSYFFLSENRMETIAERKILHFIEASAIRTMNPSLCVQKQSILALQFPW